MLAEILHKVAGQFSQEEHDYYPRPSLAGPERCIRQLVYWGIKTAGKSLPGRTLHVFNDGNWHEELTADWIRKTAYTLNSVQMGVDCGTRHNIHLFGKIDGIVTDMLKNDYLLEHKGLNHFTYQRYTNGEIPIDYVTQVCLYLEGLQKVNPDIKEAVLLIKNKNTSQFLEFIIALENGDATIKKRTDSSGETVEMNVVIEHIVDDAFKKFAEVDRYISNNRSETSEMPHRPYEMDSWHCQYCQYQETCWKGYEDEYKALSDDAALDDEVATLCHYYLETNMHLKEMEAEKDSLRNKILAAL
ncbi:MAG: hypothetical protein EHM85_19765, partial [Desulfobacteraceae bacterium]